VVSGITGRQSVDLRVVGAANHAGTTPMDLRHDALAAAAAIVLAVEGLPADTGIRVATCGFVQTVPNVRNVVPGEVGLGIELRGESTAAIEAAMARLDERVEAVASARGVVVERAWGQRVPPRRTASVIADSSRRAAEHNDLPYLELPSGAGHDAQ